MAERVPPTARDRTLKIPGDGKPIMPLGSRTPWGTVEAVGITGGERYYWMINRRGVISMMPAFVVEPNDE